MSTDVVLPPLGESVVEATVSRWLKSVGDSVAADEPLLEVSTDKVDTEIPAPAAGVLLHIFCNEDDVARVGDVLAVIGDQASNVSSFAPPVPAARPLLATTANADWGEPVAATQPWTPSWHQTDDITKDDAGVDETPEADDEADDADEQQSPTTVLPPAPAAPSAPQSGSWRPPPPPWPTPIWRTLYPGDDDAAPAPDEAPARDETDELARIDDTAKIPVTPAEPDAVEVPSNEPVYVTPLVRKLAAELHLDLASIAGSGVGGRIRKQDLLDAAARRDADTPAQPKPPADPRRGTTRPLSPTRAAQAKMVAQTAAVAQSVGLEADVTALLAGIASRARYLGPVLSAVAATLHDMPEINASVADDAVTYHDSENIGLAIDTPDGTVTPVLHGAADMTPDQIGAAAADLADRAATGRLAPSDLAGGTFTVRDDGPLGVAWAIPSINRPQVAALSLGQITSRPGVVEDAAGQPTIATRDMVWLTLSYDRRVIDPATAAAFLARLRDSLNR